MITFENGALTIDTSLSRADSQAISAFADTVRNGEQERIIKMLQEHTTWKKEEIREFITGPRHVDHVWCNVCLCYRGYDSEGLPNCYCS